MINLSARVNWVGGTSAVARAILEAAKFPTSEMAHAFAEDGKARIVANASKFTPRSGNRSRGSAHLASPGNYRTRVFERPYGFMVSFFIVGDDRFRAKFHSLNTGSASHVIRPHGPYKLAFPLPEGGPYVFRRMTNHPGTSGSLFYDEAIMDALANFG